MEIICGVCAYNRGVSVEEVRKITETPIHGNQFSGPRYVPKICRIPNTSWPYYCDVGWCERFVHIPVGSARILAASFLFGSFLSAVKTLWVTLHYPCVLRDVCEWIYIHSQTSRRTHR